MFLLHTAFTIVHYCVFSICEWGTHKYLMHEEQFGGEVAQLGKRHLTHHNLTKYDMTIKKFNEYENSKKKAQITSTFRGKNVLKEYEGLYFLWPITIFIIIISNIVAFIINIILFKCNNIYVLILSTFLSLYQSAIWNSLHPQVHYQNRQLKWHEGLDIINRKWLSSTNIYKWLWKNHVLHHLITGNKQGNYNVTMPFADFIFGTYHTFTDKYIIDDNTFTIKEAKKQ